MSFILESVPGPFGEDKTCLNLKQQNVTSRRKIVCWRVSRPRSSNIGAVCWQLRSDANPTRRYLTWGWDSPLNYRSLRGYILLLQQSRTHTCKILQNPFVSSALFSSSCYFVPPVLKFKRVNPRVKIVDCNRLNVPHAPHRGYEMQKMQCIFGLSVQGFCRNMQCTMMETTCSHCKSSR